VVPKVAGSRPVSLPKSLNGTFFYYIIKVWVRSQVGPPKWGFWIIKSKSLKGKTEFRRKQSFHDIKSEKIG